MVRGQVGVKYHLLLHYQLVISFPSGDSVEKYRIFSESAQE